MDRRHLILLCLLVIALSSCGTASPPPGPVEIPSVTLVEAYPSLTFNQPLEYVAASDGSERAFVAEKAGRVLVFRNDPQVVTPGVFLDLRAKVDSSGFEKGLLGMALHPRFAENGRFYVNYTANGQSVIAEYRVNPKDPNKALVSSERLLLAVRQPYANHNGGHLAFGPDGFLYIGMGDGGSAGDPQGNAQNLTSLLGKILRIDVDGAQAGKPYGVPASNPWAGNQLGYREEIYAYGFRNPWKFSFDRGTGKLWAADVGQDAVEEVDVVEKGLNYGWNLMEGKSCYPPGRECDTEGLELPIWEYRHPFGQSVTGGFVYRGTELSGLAGYYIYGDYVTGLIWALRTEGGDVPANRLLLESGLRISSFGVDENSELYVLDLRGKIYRLQAAAK